MQNVFAALPKIEGCHNEFDLHILTITVYFAYVTQYHIHFAFVTHAKTTGICPYSQSSEMNIKNDKANQLTATMQMTYDNHIFVSF